MIGYQNSTTKPMRDSRSFFTLSLITILFVVTLVPYDAYASGFRAAGTGDGAGQEHGGCSNPMNWGEYECWVENSREHGGTYFDPKVTVAYQTSFSVAGTTVARHVNRKTLGITECAYITHYGFPIRVCARVSGPGRHGNPHDRPKICAYQDPCDAMDCVKASTGKAADHSFNPYHEDTPREGAKSASEAAKLGIFTSDRNTGIAIALGAGFAMLPTLGIAAGMAALVAAIMEKYNDIVIKLVGCVDLPIAPGPPPFCNDCAHGLDPRPTVRESSSATFFNSKIKVDVCKNPYSAPPNRIVRCSDPDVVTPTSVVAETHEFILNQSNDYSSCWSDLDGRKFCASVPLYNPKRICVSACEETSDSDVPVQRQCTLNNGDSGELREFACVDRPGYMPNPRIINTSSSSGSIPEIRVNLNGDDSTVIRLSEDPGIYDASVDADPDWDKNCGVLHQVEFCLSRKCFMEEEIDTPSSVPTRCTAYDSKVCLKGFDSVPSVVATNIDDPSSSINEIGKAIGGAPNTEYAPGQTIEIEGKAPLTLALGAWVYNPPLCYELDADGNCVNRDGVCAVAGQDPCTDFVNNIAPGSDPYTIDSSPIDEASCGSDSTVRACQSKQILRPMNPEELGLCVSVPPLLNAIVYDTPGTYTFTPPDQCLVFDVKMWAGGDAGYIRGGRRADRPGRAGGYARGRFVAPSADTQYTLVVGAGGSGNGGLGLDSMMYQGNNLLSSPAMLAATATDGDYSSLHHHWHGYGVGTRGVILERHQGNGLYARNQNGLNPHGGTGVPYSFCESEGAKHGDSKTGMPVPFGTSYGAGGCSKDDDYTTKGGDGVVIINCQYPLPAIYHPQSNGATPAPPPVYVVGSNCGDKLRVRLWGAGGGGYAEDDGDGPNDTPEGDRRGGGGAYAEWEVPAIFGEQIKVILGTTNTIAGGRIDRSGSPTIAFVDSNNNNVRDADEKYLQAGGGLSRSRDASQGGVSDAVWPGVRWVTSVNGSNAYANDSEKNDLRGERATGVDSGVLYHDCTTRNGTTMSAVPASGGCAYDDGGTELYSPAGPSRASIQCILPD